MCLKGFSIFECFNKGCDPLKKYIIPNDSVQFIEKYSGTVTDSPYRFVEEFSIIQHRHFCILYKINSSGDNYSYESPVSKY